MTRTPTSIGTSFAVLATLLAATASAQPRPEAGEFWYFGQPGRTQSGVKLLAIPEVRAELGTTADQDAELDRLAAEVRARAGEAFRGLFRRPQAAGDEERQKRRDAANERIEEIAAEAEAKLAAVLRPGQVERLGQLKLRWEGVMAVARPEFADRLGLSPEQKDRAARLVAAYRSRRDTPRPGASAEEREAYFARVRERRETTEAELRALLTDEQKAKWEAAQGKPFTFPGGQGR